MAFIRVRDEVWLFWVKEFFVAVSIIFNLFEFNSVCFLIVVYFYLLSICFICNFFDILFGG